MPASVRPEIAFDGRAILGEGPVWDAERQWLVWLDILPGLVHRFDPATGGDHVFGVGKPVGSAVHASPFEIVTPSKSLVTAKSVPSRYNEPTAEVSS